LPCCGECPDCQSICQAQDFQTAGHEIALDLVKQIRAMRAAGKDRRAGATSHLVHGCFLESRAGGFEGSSRIGPGCVSIIDAQ
jgi:hypothetical protein